MSFEKKRFGFARQIEVCRSGREACNYWLAEGEMPKVRTGKAGRVEEIARSFKIWLDRERERERER